MYCTNNNASQVTWREHMHFGVKINDRFSLWNGHEAGTSTKTIHTSDLLFITLLTIRRQMTSEIAKTLNNQKWRHQYWQNTH